MAFPDYIVDQAWDNADGKCESCGRELRKESRCSESEYGWEVHHKFPVASGGSDSLSNCEILCLECHKETVSYGG